VRLARVDKYRIASVIERLLPFIDEQPLAGKLWIVDESSVRVRG